MIWIVVAVVALATAPLTAEAGATAPPAAAWTSGTIIHTLPGPQVFPESVAVDGPPAASGSRP